MLRPIQEHEKAPPCTGAVNRGPGEAKDSRGLPTLAATDTKRPAPASGADALNWGHHWHAKFHGIAVRSGLMRQGVKLQVAYIRIPIKVKAEVRNHFKVAQPRTAVDGHQEASHSITIQQRTVRIRKKSL